MRKFNGSWDYDKMTEITFEELLEENKEFLQAEEIQNIGEELEKMMRDVHPLKFESEEEEMLYIERVNQYFMKPIPVYNHNLGEWVNYTFDEMEECFNFVNKPDFSKIEDIHLHNVGYQNKWIEISFKNGNSKIYNFVFGTYVEQ